MFTCARCNNNVSDGVTCSGCRRQFDFSCAGISEINFRKLGERRNNWRCSDCKGVSTPVTRDTNASLQSQIEEMKASLAFITRQLTPLATLVEDVKTIKADLAHLKDSTEMAHESVRQLSDSVKSIDDRVSCLEESQNSVSKIRDTLTMIQDDLRIKEQLARSNNIEIKGVPFKKSENLYNLVYKIGEVVQTPIRKEDINYIARVPSPQGDSQKNIIVALHNRYTKEEFIAAARKHKGLQLSGLGFSSDLKYFINDHLTLHNKSLLKEAKRLASDNNFRYVWVKHCQILVRKSDTSPIIRIKNENDLQKISREKD
ncbi:uncharacterized protein LOC128679231 [Plodia interpunctella]|uniref:uncharacterized protein LOC128679231 n=1 Tax=Plodia interpunctella TaxID=58824 RepID=UPI002368EBC9|nr:uncharacterized protein LOC128679231 [Plodia interpunctella]